MDSKLTCPRLCPHESAETDIILVGHSMGGILAAEVVLLPPYSRASNEKFRHRILGTINFDTPFLGMHPGVVVSGIGSLFRPAFGPPGPQPPGIQTEKLEARPMPAANSGFPASVHTPVSANLTNVQPSSNSEYSDSNIIGKQTAASPGTVGQTLSSPPLCSGDPNYNPPFGNDMRTPVRTGWDNAIHFVTKHSDGLTRAAKSYVTSHLEFGGCLADYKALKNRYSKIRALEDIRMHQENQSTRVRFVNYYTASTGRPKKVKPSPQSKPSANASELQVSGPIEQELQDMSLSTPEYQSQIETPRISLEHQDRKDCPRTFQILDQAFPMDSNQSSIEDTEMDNMTPEMSLLEANLATDEGFGKKEAENIVDIPAVEPQSPSTDCAPGLPNNGGTVLDYRAIEQELGLLPLPPPPQPPPAHDPTGFADKDARQLAYKEHIRLNKAYLRAFKDRQKAILARENLMEKRTKAARKATEKVSKLTEKERLRVEKEQAMRRPPLTPVEVKSAIIPDSSSIPVDSYDDKGSTGSDVNSRLRDKKFCMLPPKINEQIDPCWVRIFMQGVDEVGAHCGLFFVGEQYERLVADVGDRIKLWVEES